MQNVSQDLGSELSPEVINGQHGQSILAGKLCDFVIEIGLIALLCLALVSRSPASTGEFTIIVGSFVSLSTIFFTKKLSYLQSNPGKLGFTFFFIFLFVFIGQQTISLNLSSRSTTIIPISSLIILICTISWIFKIVIQKESENSHQEIFHPYLLAAGFVLIFSIVLYVPLRIIYYLDFRTLTEIFFPIFAFILLFGIITKNITHAVQVRRITVYMIATCLGLLLRSFIF